jgi:hypothetical protein
MNIKDLVGVYNIHTLSSTLTLPNHEFQYHCRGDKQLWEVF